MKNYFLLFFNCYKIDSRAATPINFLYTLNKERMTWTFITMVDIQKELISDLKPFCERDKACCSAWTRQNRVT